MPGAHDGVRALGGLGVRELRDDLAGVAGRPLGGGVVAPDGLGRADRVSAKSWHIKAKLSPSPFDGLEVLPRELLVEPRDQRGGHQPVAAGRLAGAGQEARCCSGDSVGVGVGDRGLVGSVADGVVVGSSELSGPLSSPRAPGDQERERGRCEQWPTGLAHGRIPLRAGTPTTLVPARIRKADPDSGAVRCVPVRWTTPPGDGG